MTRAKGYYCECYLEGVIEDELVETRGPFATFSEAQAAGEWWNMRNSDERADGCFSVVDEDGMEVTK